jgi:type II secretion system (T2SS) protein G
VTFLELTNTLRMRLVNLFRFTLLAVIALTAIPARAELSSSQARKLIARMAGSELPNSAVRIKTITATGDSSVEVAAEILTTFRLAPNDRGLWRAVEVRTGPNRWESLELLSTSPEVEKAASHCDVWESANSKAKGPEPSTRRARCVIAALLSVRLPSDAVRIKNVDASALPFGSTPSSVVEALITVDVRIQRESTGWAVKELRTGSRDWVSLGTLVAAANEEKARRARADLQAIARALEEFRSERHAYVVSDSQVVLIDHLSPRYLKRVIRLDPWNRPYHYRGDSGSFTLSSTGADGKENTPDDISISGPAKLNS